MDKREAYQEKAEAQLEELNARIALRKAKADEVKAERIEEGCFGARP